MYFEHKIRKCFCIIFILQPHCSCIHWINFHFLLSSHWKYQILLTLCQGEIFTKREDIITWKKTDRCSFVVFKNGINEIFVMKAMCSEAIKKGYLLRFEIKSELPTFTMVTFKVQQKDNSWSNWLLSCRISEFWISWNYSLLRMYRNH